MRRSLVLSVVLAALFPLTVAIIAWFAVPHFESMLAAFGAEIPLSSAVLLATYRWWWLLPLVVLLPVVLWPQSKDPLLAVLITGIVLATVMFLFGLYACYWPIFSLAAVSDA